MADNFPPPLQRRALQALADALGCPLWAVRRDECGDWRLEGRKGHIYAGPSEFMIYCRPGSALGWTMTKAALSFLVPRSDAEDEGIFGLAHHPGTQDAQALRKRLKLPKRRILTREEKERLAKWAFAPISPAARLEGAT